MNLIYDENFMNEELRVGEGDVEETGDFVVYEEHFGAAAVDDIDDVVDVVFRLLVEVFTLFDTAAGG